MTFLVVFGVPGRRYVSLRAGSASRTNMNQTGLPEPQQPYLVTARGNADLGSQTTIWELWGDGDSHSCLGVPQLRAPARQDGGACAWGRAGWPT